MELGGFVSDLIEGLGITNGLVFLEAYIEHLFQVHSDHNRILLNWTPPTDP